MQLKKKSARERKTQSQTIQLLLYVEMSELAKPPRQHFCWLLRSVAKAKLRISASLPTGLLNLGNRLAMLRAEDFEN